VNNDQYDHLADNLYAAVISDVLDAAGRRNQVLDARVTHCLGPGVLVGRAATMLAGEQVEVEGEPYALQVEATDALREDDVIVATTRVTNRPPSGVNYSPLRRWHAGHGVWCWTDTSETAAR
jgi:hypothetical protein